MHFWQIFVSFYRLKNGCVENYSFVRCVQCPKMHNLSYQSHQQFREKNLIFTIKEDPFDLGGSKSQLEKHTKELHTQFATKRTIDRELSLQNNKMKKIYPIKTTLP